MPSVEAQSAMVSATSGSAGSTGLISANLPGLATTDAGLKAFATDAGPPRIVGGAPHGTRYTLFGDEQGRLEFAQGNALETGATVTCAVPHCDPTVNLYDRIYCCRGESLEDVWRISARGTGP